MGKNRKKKGVSTHDTTLHVDDDRDSRFDASKPQFRQQQQRDSKVVLDERFASVLTDPRFRLDVQDKYGRRQHRKGRKEKDELSEFYTVDNSHKDEEDGTRLLRQSDKQNPVDNGGGDDDNSSSDEAGDRIKEQPSSRIAYLTALSRGLLDVSSSSSSEEEEEEESSSEDDSGTEDEKDDNLLDKGYSDGEDEKLVNEVPGVLDPSTKDTNIELTSEATPYLAVLNMDWSHVRAVDVYALLSSFAPSGAVKRVRVFLSDFGKQKLLEEERIGPGIWKDAPKSKDGLPGGESPSAVDGTDNDSHSSETSNDNDSGDNQDPLDCEDFLPNAGDTNSGFDPEKLRAYEAAKLKYYFAIVEFSSPEVADVVYKEVDGMEFEHSSASVDLRAIQPSDLDGVIKGRDVRDEATRIPSNYLPPEFIVGALQQTNVQCTWEAGDRDRENALTKYTSRATWQCLAESDDLRAYLASDVSSEEEPGSDNEKAINKRKLLGLDSDDEEIGSKTSSGSESESESEDDGDKMSKEVTYIPGQPQSDLESKIRSKLQSSTEAEELTPWQKYQRKRKEKRKERRQAARAKRQPYERSSNSDEETESSLQHGDQSSFSGKQTREELELLLAGEDQEEDAKDYDMRELQRLEKYREKKLRGSRKRKESERAAAAPGVDFELDVRDERFNAVLEGDDDRFGIDRTNPNYKETPAMKQILKEQARRRKSKKQKLKPSQRIVPNVSADEPGEHESRGAAALSALVTRIKSKVKP